GSATTSSTLALISLIFSKSAISKSASSSSRLAGAERGAESLPRIRLTKSVQPSQTRSSSGDSAADIVSTKVSSQRCRQPGVARPGDPPGTDGLFVADVHGRWRSLEDDQLLSRGGHMRNALHGSRAGADYRGPLVCEPVHRRAVRAAAGVGVVPAAGVERMAAEGRDAWDAGQLGDVQRAGPDGDEGGRELVAAVCPHDPRAAPAVPLEISDLGVEQRALVQPVALGDPVAVRAYLWCVRVPLRGHVPCLLE